MNEKIQFHSPTKGTLEFQDVIRELVAFMETNPQKDYRVVIGTDSQAKKPSKSKRIDFVTAIVVHKIGSGGRFFWRKTRRNKINTLREKIYHEVMLSIGCAQKMLSLLENYIIEDGFINNRFEIHVDVGTNGPTRDMIKEVVGMVKGNGFHVKTKPEAYGATVVADRYV